MLCLMKCGRRGSMMNSVSSLTSSREPSSSEHDFLSGDASALVEQYDVKRFKEVTLSLWVFSCFSCFRLSNLSQVSWASSGCCSFGSPSLRLWSSRLSSNPMICFFLSQCSQLSFLIRLLSRRCLSFLSRWPRDLWWQDPLRLGRSVNY